MTNVMSTIDSLESHADKGWGRVRSRLREPTKEELQALKDRDVANFLDSVAWATISSKDQRAIVQRHNLIATTMIRESSATYSDPGEGTLLSTSKTRQKKSVKVDFAEGSPEIIGEGGDESREPAMTVSRVRERLLVGARAYSCDAIPKSKSKRPEMSRLVSTTRFPSTMHDSLPPSPVSPTSMAEAFQQLRKLSQVSLDGVVSETMQPEVQAVRHENIAPELIKRLEQDTGEHRWPKTEQLGHVDTSSNGSRTSSIDAEYRRAHDQSIIGTALSSCSMTRHNSFDSIGSMEGCILGSTPPRSRAGSVQRVLRRKENFYNGPMSNTLMRPRANTFNESIQGSEATTRTAPQPIPRAAAPKMPYNITNSPLSRQFSWRSDVSDVSEHALDTEVSQSTYVRSNDQDESLSPTHIRLPERHPDRPYMLAPLTFQPAVTSGSPAVPHLNRLVAPQFDRRPSEPILSQSADQGSTTPVSPSSTDIYMAKRPGVAPSFERRDSEPILTVHTPTRLCGMYNRIPQKSYLVPPPSDRRPSEPKMILKRSVTELPIPPKNERRPSAPFADQSAIFSDMNHPAYRRASTDNVPQIGPKPKMAPRRGSANNIERKTTHAPQYPSRLALAISRASSEDVVPTLTTIQPNPELTPETSPDSATRPSPTRSASYTDARNIALSEFVDRTSHMSNVISISAMAIPTNTSTAKWLQLATFWLLKGRAGLHIYLSMLERQALDEDPIDDLTAGQTAAMLAQQHLNIFKTWWIVSEVLGDRLSAADTLPEFGNAAMKLHQRTSFSGESYKTEVLKLTDALMERFKDLAKWIREEELLPVLPMLVPGLDAGLGLVDKTFPEDLTLLRRML